MPQLAEQLLEAGMSVHESRDEVTKHLLEAALRKTKGNKMQAAKLVRLHRNNFDHYLVRLGINWREYRWPTRSRRKNLAVPAAG